MTRQLLSPVRLDLEGVRKNLLRQGTPNRVFFFEHGIAPNVKEEISRRFDIDSRLGGDNDRERQWDREIAVQRFLGFELFRVWLPGGEFDVAGSLGTTWAEEHAGPIQSWNDLERYSWPDPKAIDYGQLEYYERRLPPEMRVFHSVKIWEVVRELLGFDAFCMKMHDDPDLVDEVIRRVTEFHSTLAKTLCDFQCIGAIYGADDYAYKTSTMMSPAYIIEHFLPGHRQMAQYAHDREKLFFFHCCGKCDTLMDNLIDTVKIDAKHSFEDNVTPVTEFKRLWGHRVAMLGGIDVDFVARSHPQEISRRVRQTLDICQPGGGYCLGMGNWVTSYIPVDNYLAVLEAGRRWPGD
ncbi:MAG: uroporphyrinogen decarboxylase family protein [Thermoguttaceae bacterium]